jgi:hypothetical protein
MVSKKEQNAAEVAQKGLGADLPEIDLDFAGSLPTADYSDAPEYAEELWYSWVAPARVFRPRMSKTYLRNLILLFVLIVLLLIFVNGFALLIVVLSIIFLMFVLANVPPLKTRHTITNYGIYAHDKFYSWDLRGQRFWWEEDSGQKYVVVEIKVFPYRLIMLAGPEANEQAIEAALSEALIKQKPPEDGVDKFVSWIRNTFPLG